MPLQTLPMLSRVAVQGNRVSPDHDLTLTLAFTLTLTLTITLAFTLTLTLTLALTLVVGSNPPLPPNPNPNCNPYVVSLVKLQKLGLAINTHTSQGGIGNPTRDGVVYA